MTVSNVVLQNYHRAFPALFRADMRLHVCIVDVTPEKGKHSGVGFAPLHWPLGHPVFFMTGPRITEISLSGSTWSCIFNFQGPPACGSRSFSEVGRCRDNSVSYFRAKVYGLVVQVTHPLSSCIVYSSPKKQKTPAWKAKPSLCPQTGCLSTRLL